MKKKVIKNFKFNYIDKIIKTNIKLLKLYNYKIKI